MPSHQAKASNPAWRDKPETPPGAVLFRRGPAPVPAGHRRNADGSLDYGFFGPDSVVWQVLLHPAQTAMLVQVTEFLQFTNAAMGANMIQHDPLLRAAEQGRANVGMTLSRHRRTFGVVVPALLGDKPSAEAVCSHLRRFHSKMQGIIPGTRQPYDAAGEAMVLYGHVTIMHAALLVYEHAAWRGYHAPRRLSDAKRDRYWAEAAPFAVLMGARDSDVPRSVAEVRDYYARCEPQYYNWPLVLNSLIQAVQASIHPSQWRREPRAAAIASLIIASHLPAIGMLPQPVRRHMGLPRWLDRAFDAIQYASRPGFALLNMTSLGERIQGWMVGTDGVELIRNARRLMASKCEP